MEGSKVKKGSGRRLTQWRDDIQVMAEYQLGKRQDQMESDGGSNIPGLSSGGHDSANGDVPY